MYCLHQAKWRCWAKQSIPMVDEEEMRVYEKFHARTWGQDPDRLKYTAHYTMYIH